MFIDDSGEHQIGDDGGNTVEQPLVGEEEFASDDVQSPPEGDKNKLSLNEELGQLGVLNPPTPLSPDSKDSSTSQKGTRTILFEIVVTLTVVDSSNKDTVGTGNRKRVNGSE